MRRGHNLCAIDEFVGHLETVKDLSVANEYLHDLGNLGLEGKFSNWIKYKLTRECNTSRVKY